ncbi:hypothetical protein M0R45_008190 [Rubus argutus]|uniref:Uncharacterized protein n=1 Tax=Rubus argutus TaxID=59490 RepID=A0AAW1Y112_RUBAR
MGRRFQGIKPTAGLDWGGCSGFRELIWISAMVVDELWSGLKAEEEEIDEEEEEPFHEAYAERGCEGETRSEALAVKELDGGDGIRFVEGTVDENRENEAGEDEEEKKENEQFAMPTTRHSICMMTFRTMPVLGTGVFWVS